jgi:hypothetical protein
MSNKAFWLCVLALGLTTLMLFNGKTSQVPAEAENKEIQNEVLEEILPPPDIRISEENLPEVMGLGTLEMPPIASGENLVIVKEAPQNQAWSSMVTQAPQAFTGETLSSCIPRDGYQACDTLLIISAFRTNMVLAITEMINNPSCGGDGFAGVKINANTQWSFNTCHPSGYASGGYNSGENGGYIIGAGACNVATLVNSALVQLNIPTYRMPHILNVGGVRQYVPIPRADGTYFPQDHTVVIQAGTSGDLSFIYGKAVEMLFEINQNSIVVHVRAE